MQFEPNTIVLYRRGPNDYNSLFQILNDFNIVEIISGLRVLKDESYLSFTILFHNQVCISRENCTEGTLRAYTLLIRSICILIDEHGDFRLNFAITKLLVK